MLRRVGKWLKIHEDEITIFLWCALILFLIRSSNVLFNNFAETAFLKRFGVEYLPVVYMANSITTFVIMGFMAGIMAGVPGSRLLNYMLLFCGTTVAGLRFVIPLGIDLLYPVLFVLKSQYEVLLGLLFWNLANDLFNTRQSKRLFPLITAGGVLGGIIGSFATPTLAKTISLDNLMLAYLGTTVLGALSVKRMGTLFPTLLMMDTKGKRVKGRTSMKEELKKVWPMIRESRLVRILVMLTLLPNIVIPIMNYQFNFAIDQAFVTEGKMIAFFGYFRGALNVISLIILLFVGRIYGRWGLPVALMFHPFNYLLAFMAFLLRFDIISAMYARISTNVLRTTINNPARAVLVGLVPPEYRSVVRPFLRGTVVRLGILVGSGLIMLSESLVHPRYLSIAAGIFVAVWIGATIMLKKGYSGILLGLISRNMLDLKSMREEDVSQVFADKQIKNQLLQAFSSARGEDCLWHARLLKSLGVEDLDTHILSALKTQDDRTKIGLLPLVSPKAGKEALKVFKEIANTENRELMVAILKALHRFPFELFAGFSREIFENANDPEVKAYAVSGLYRVTPRKYREIIDSWLESEDSSQRMAGIIAAGASGDHGYILRLKELLERERESALLPHILKAIHELGGKEANLAARPYLIHPIEEIRLAALDALEIEDDNDLKSVIALLDDPSERIQVRAKEKLQTASYQNAQVLVESLIIPSRRVREAIFELLESLNIKDLDIYRFARSQIETSYGCLAEAEALRPLSPVPERDLLIDHLEQKCRFHVENTLRVLAAQDRTARMRTIWRGIYSADPRQRANSIEALDDSMDPSLSKVLMPLIEDSSHSERLAVGKKYFQLPLLDFNSPELYSRLLTKEDWVTVILTLNLLTTNGLVEPERGIMEALTSSDNDHVRWMAQRYLNLQGLDAAQREAFMESEISLPDKILHLKGIHIFQGLTVGELAAIASVTEEVVFPAGQTVIKQGEPGETMYLIISGEVSVIKEDEEGQEIELDRIGKGDYFGEMALFEGDVRSATIRPLEDTRLLVLHKREFTEIVREYPQIALAICKVLSQRLRELHHKIKKG